MSPFGGLEGQWDWQEVCGKFGLGSGGVHMLPKQRREGRLTAAWVAGQFPITTLAGFPAKWTLQLCLEAQIWDTEEAQTLSGIGVEQR